jgi:predicted esterase
MLLTSRLSLTLLLTALVAGSLWAQDAELALSTSVGYNTQRLSLNLTPEQAKEAERLGQEATAATRANKFGDALNDYAQGLAVMHNVEWTPETELASALRGKLDHSLIAPGKVTVSVAPLYPASHAAAAKLSASIFLVGPEKEATNIGPAAGIDPAKMPFTEQVAIPQSAAGNYTIEVRLTPAGGTVPAGLNGVFVKALPIHVEDLSADARRLRDSLAKLGESKNSQLPTAQYTLALYEMVDKGQGSPRTYNFKTEFATAQKIIDTIQAGSDPFAGKHGDFRKAYRSGVDQTLQPYRLFIPDGYDAGKPTPMVVALHGMGGDENSMFDQYGKELTKDAQGHGFIVVAPKGRAQASMYRGTAEQDVLDVIAEVERDYKVDKARVYLMGHSMGGFGTWSVAIAHPELFAALGPISGGGSPAGMVKIKDIPQYVTHGDNDKTVNVESSRTMVAAGKKAGAQITYVEVPGGSHVSVAQPAFAPMLDFFAKVTKGKSATE